MKIGQLVQRFVPNIIDYCLNTDQEEIVRLQDLEYSKNTFGISSYPFWSTKDNINESKRFWTDIYMIHEDEFRVSSQWTTKHIKFFKEYLISKKIATKEELDRMIGDNEAENNKQQNKEIKSDWPTWETPSIEDIRIIAHLLTPYLKFLHPEIIRKITLSNIELNEYFTDYLTRSGIDTKDYIWEKSSTTFPGIRRANGKTDNEFKKRQLPKEHRRGKGAIYIDDNSYPKQLWAYIFTNKQFSNQGPVGYELAHIFEHKAVSRLYEEFIVEDDSYDLLKPISGMFTNAAGLMYAPRTFVKITDHSSHARRLIQQKVLKLYGDVTNVLPPSVSLKKQDDEWDMDSFDWGEPVGDPNNVDQFLRFRKERIEKILDLEIPKKR